MKNTTALLLIILAVALFYTFTRPMYSGAKELALTASEHKNVLRNISDIIATRDRLLGNYNSISKAEIERLSKALPQNVDTVRLALDLDNIAAKYGISITSVSLDSDSEQDNNQIVLPGSKNAYEKALVSVTFVSNYENFRSFLADLEKSLRIMDVRSVSFTTLDSGLYEHDILLETYWVQ